VSTTKTKRCPICNTVKSIKRFYRYFSKVRNRYRISNYCKDCAKTKGTERAKEHYKKHCEAKKEYQRNYGKGNRESIRPKQRDKKRIYRSQLTDTYLIELFHQHNKEYSRSEIRRNPTLIEAMRTRVLSIRLKSKLLRHGKEQTI
jgi:hypothetical protein